MSRITNKVGGGGRVLMFLMRIAGFLIGRPKIISGKEHLQRIAEGNTVVITNHRHWFDPVLLLPLLPGTVRTMAKAELFQNKMLADIMTAAGAFPVRRGENDLGAFRQASLILKKGHSLLIYPEGTRNNKTSLLPFHSGAAALALRSRSAVIPIYVIPFRPLFSRAKIVIGEAIDLETAIPRKSGAGKRAQEATAFLQQEMEKISKYPAKQQKT